MSTSLPAPRVRLLLDEICGKMGGSWLLTGGALVMLEFDPKREAHNIDLVAIQPKEGVMALQRQIDSLAHPLGFGSNAVRTLAEGYLLEVPDWDRHTVELRSFSMGRLLRPDLTLFVYLKLRRGTDRDLYDIRAAVLKIGAREFNVAALAAWASTRRDLIERYHDQHELLGLPKMP